MQSNHVILSKAETPARTTRRLMFRCASHDALAYLCMSVFIGGLFLGCSGYTGPRSIVNPDPAVKIPQIRRAVDAGDRSVIPQLVTDLDSNDSAVRFYSIGALQRLTGETFDYDWTVADRHQREPWIAKWHDYVAANGPTTKASRR